MSDINLVFDQADLATLSSLIEADDAHAARLELITTVTASLVELAHDHLDVGGGELKHKSISISILFREIYNMYFSYYLLIK